jgi:hypothetical protein
LGTSVCTVVAVQPSEVFSAVTELLVLIEPMPSNGQKKIDNIFFLHMLYNENNIRIIPDHEETDDQRRSSTSMLQLNFMGLFGTAPCSSSTVELMFIF